MNRAETTLTWLLRVTGVVMLSAVAAVCMPFGWMDAIHQWLGLGELPEGPIVGYLARSISALYAAHGVLVIFVSFDVRRYLSVIRCLAWLGIAFGASMLAVDAAVGMPLWWTLSEGPYVIAFAAVVLWLARRIDAVAKD